MLELGEKATLGRSVPISAEKKSPSSSRKSKPQNITTLERIYESIAESQTAERAGRKKPRSIAGKRKAKVEDKMMSSKMNYQGLYMKQYSMMP